MKKLSPEITLELGGTERHIRFDMNMLRDAENHLNYDWVREEPKAMDDPSRVSAFDQTLFEPMNADKALVFIWAGLLHEEEKLTIREVGHWLSIDVIVDFMKNSDSIIGELKMVMDEMGISTDAPEKKKKKGKGKR